MRLKLEAKCGQCQELLTDNVVERGICDECWKFSSEEKADIVAENLLKEVNGFSPLLQTLMGTSPLLKIARIKDVRQHTGMNLKHAKRCVDEVNNLLPAFEKPEVMEELKQLRATASANIWAAETTERLQADLVDSRTRLQTEIAEAQRLRLSAQNLEARLGASNRELAEAEKDLNELREKAEAAEKLSEALNLLAKDNVTRDLARALGTILEDALRGEDTDGSF